MSAHTLDRTLPIVAAAADSLGIYTSFRCRLLETPEDRFVPADKVEWYTKRHGVHILTGIMVKVDCTKKMLSKAAKKLPTPRAFPAAGTTSAAEKRQLLKKVQFLQGETQYGESRDAVTNACAFHRTCWGVLEGVGIPRAHFDHYWDRCFCENCMAARGDEPVYHNAQHGPEPYVLPKGYAKFGLNIDKARAKARGFWTEWSNCYHGTRHAALKDVVECGYLLVPGNTNHKGRVLCPPLHRHDDDDREPPPEGKQQDQAQIFTSPSIAYVSHKTYAEPITATDGNIYNVGSRTLRH